MCERNLGTAEIANSNSWPQWNSLALIKQCLLNPDCSRMSEQVPQMKKSGQLRSTTWCPGSRSDQDWE